MPIYAYRCSNCGFQQDVLRKISDPKLTSCPTCGQETYVKQLTAAGFQLKGSGWYVTDFREGAGKAAKKDDAAPDAAKPESTDAKPSGGDGATPTPAAAPSPAPAPASAPSPSPAPSPPSKPASD
jgi:putative FmdB family regulatory protein